MKNTFKLIIFIIFILSAVITLVSIQSHEGNILNYLVFCILINFLLIYTLNSRSLFFEIYFAVFIWLGFWFKYSLSLVFLNGIIYDSGPIINMANIDKAIFTSIVIFHSFFSFCIEKIFKKKEFVLKSSF